MRTVDSRIVHGLQIYYHDRVWMVSLMYEALCLYTLQRKEGGKKIEDCSAVLRVFLPNHITPPLA